MFMTGLGLLVLSSLVCGLAPSSVVLVGGRLSQGVAGALLMPAALSLLMGTFPSGRARIVALATWSAVGGIGATAGLLLGGLVTQGLGWQWVFWLNVPTGLVMLALTPKVLKEPAQLSVSRRVDVPGTAAITIGLAFVVFGVTMVPEQGWVDLHTTVPLGIGLGCLGVFAWVERRSSEPMIPTRLLRSRAVIGGNLVLLTAGMCVDGLLFTLTLFTQQTLNYSPLRFGLLTGIMTSVSVGATYLAQRAMTRVGERPVAAAGMALLTLTGLTFAGAVRWGGPVAALSAGMLLFGLGMGGAFVAGSVSSLAGVPEEDSGIAAGVQNISFSLGATMGVALLSTVAASTTPTAGALATGAWAVGQQVAFVVAAALAVAGCLAARLIPPAPRRDLLETAKAGAATPGANRPAPEP